MLSNMPELPEVEMVRRQLTDKILHKEIRSVSVHDEKSVDYNDDFSASIVGQEISGIDRKGKYLFLSLSKNGLYITCHLRMTGRLIYVPAGSDEQFGGGHSLSGDLPAQPHKHTRVIITFIDGSHLYFNDMRKFGYLKLVTVQEVQKQKSSLGPEPSSPDYSTAYLTEVLEGRNTTVKAALLKQSDIAGLGNIYVDEACWRAQVRPDRIAGELTEEEIAKLTVATQSVLEDALKHGGTTFRDYVDTNGENGNFTDKLAVFGRDGKVCPRCGGVIEKSRVAGRGTHFCPDCQV